MALVKLSASILNNPFATMIAADHGKAEVPFLAVRRMKSILVCKIWLSDSNPSPYCAGQWMDIDLNTVATAAVPGKGIVGLEDAFNASTLHIAVEPSK